MAKKAKTKKTPEQNGGVKLDSIIESQNKFHGPGTLITGVELKRDPPRLPTGVLLWIMLLEVGCLFTELPVSGGRMRRGRVTCV